MYKFATFEVVTKDDTFVEAGDSVFWDEGSLIICSGAAIRLSIDGASVISITTVPHSRSPRGVNATELHIGPLISQSLN